MSDIETKMQKYEDALKKIGWETTKFKMTGEERYKEIKETLGVDDLWYMIEKVSKLANDALEDLITNG